MIDFDSFVRWQQEKPGRYVEISIGDIRTPDQIKVWVYDYDMMQGQYVSSVEEIDLEGAYYDVLRRKVEEAQAAGLLAKEAI